MQESVPQKIDNKQIKKKKFLERGPLKYGKKFYFAEFIAERTIQLVSILSILAILAIFYYVFQEATYAFKPPEQVQQNTDKQSTYQTNPKENSGHDSNNPAQNSSGSDGSSGNLKQETYSSDNPASSSASDKPETYKPESYSPDAPSDNSKNDLKPESYSPDASTDKAGSELKPETYSPDSEKPVKKEKKSKSVKSDETKILENEPVPEKNKPVADNVSVDDQVETEKLTMKKFFLPNDYIDNKPQYIWQPVGTNAKYSFIPLFIGAFKVTVIGLVIAAPIAILAAIFTVAFSPRWLREILKPAIEILAGFPSVVIGFFCLITLASVIQDTFHTTYRLNSFVGGIGMALAVIPIIYTVTEDALSSVPSHLKEASLALGATRWETAWRVLLPAATPGVFAAIILGFGRAFGETMIALMATGNAALVSADLFESVRTMAATIGSEMAEVEFHGAHYGVLFLIGAILFIVTFSLNAIAEFYVRKRLLKRFQGN